MFARLYTLIALMAFQTLSCMEESNFNTTFDQDANIKPALFSLLIAPEKKFTTIYCQNISARTNIWRGINLPSHNGIVLFGSDTQQEAVCLLTVFRSGDIKLRYATLKKPIVFRAPEVSPAYSRIVFDPTCVETWISQTESRVTLHGDELWDISHIQVKNHIPVITPHPGLMDVTITIKHTDKH